MISATNSRLQELLILHEGLSLTAYRCTAKKLTIGIGHNLEANPIPGLGPGSAITRERAMEILTEDLQACINGIRRHLPWVENLSEVRQAVLIDMTFNLGLWGLLRFKNFLASLQDGGPATDAEHMFASRWAYQVDDGPGKKFGRADRLAQMITTGEWA